MKSKQVGNHLPGSVESRVKNMGQGTGKTSPTSEKSVPARKFSGSTLQSGEGVVKPGKGM